MKTATAFACASQPLLTTGCTSPIPWWSFSKTLLAAVVLRLVDAGKLRLDDSPADDPRFTLRQLLRHEAGLPDYGALQSYHDDVAAGREPWPIDQLHENAGEQRLRYQPGTGWGYSNIGYLKIRQTIERVYGAPLNDALTKLVFAPSGASTARVAVSRADLEDVEMGGISGYHPGWVYHGLVVGTVADAARILLALLTSQLVCAQALAEMRRGIALPAFRSPNFPDPAYGLGLMLSANAAQDHPMGHSGEGPGSRFAVYGQGTQVAAVWQEQAQGDSAETQALRLLAKRTLQAGR